MKSRYRTLDKSRANFFFVPVYVKCVRIFGGLNEKEVNEHFLKVSDELVIYIFFVVSYDSQNKHTFFSLLACI